VRYIDKWLGQRKGTYLSIALAIVIIFLIRYGISWWAFRCIWICLVLMIAGIYDIKTYMIPDYLNRILIMAGLIEIQIIPALLGFVLVPLPFLLAAIMTDGEIGGGDIKIMAAAGFCIGVTSGIRMMIYGLFLAICWYCLLGKGRISLPLAPFLAVGCIMVLI